MVASGEPSRFVRSGTAEVAEKSRAYSTMDASGDSPRFAQPVVSSVRSSRLPQLVSSGSAYSIAVASSIAQSQPSLSSKHLVDSAHQVMVYHALG